ncbi:MAG: DUF2846 domain-containing protein, partial [Acidobacteria bacterium]|nr:DUF2846 domain-containing protein [Acidobacteriota bacterium]
AGHRCRRGPFPGFLLNVFPILRKRTKEEMAVNRKRDFLLVGLLLALTLALPSSVTLGQEPDEKEPANQKELEAKACGPKDHGYSVETDKKQHPTPEAPSDKALIYVIRPTMGGNKVQTKLSVDGKWVGVNRGDNYFFFTLDPGQHYFCSQAENRSVMALSVEAGKTYFLQQKIQMGFMKARNKLVQLDDAEGKKGLAKCHPSVWEDKK